MDNILELLKQNKITEIRNILSDINPVDMAEFCDELSSEQALKFFRILPKNESAEVFSYLSSEKQQEIIENITDNELKFIIDDMFLDDAVAVIEEMPANIVDRILRTSSPTTRKLINQFLQYPENSAGSVMTVEYIALKSTYTIEEAIDYIKRFEVDSVAYDICYVIDKTRKLIGSITLKALLFADAALPVIDVMESNVVCATTTVDQEEVAELFRKYDLTSMPVVDNEERLVGIITIDDIVDVIDRENTEDFHKMAAMKPSDEEYLKESIFSLAKHRIIWLLVLMLSATVTGKIIRGYEEVLSSVAVLAAYIPMLMDTGGNSGSQSATLIIRGIALGEIELKDIWKIIFKELRVSTLVGFTLAIVNFIRISAFDNVSKDINLVVCITLFFTVILAKVVGGVLPVFAKACKLDPAIMASPLITTIVDAGALLLFFTLSTKILHIG
ncbi:magnesium transporter [Fusobacterium sp. PH5-44]|uniref:magnesium transporter n=1 Tax=unclassified Fusobacterium TaxID=2648384 RepID=UPI003D1B1440